MNKGVDLLTSSIIFVATFLSRYFSIINFRLARTMDPMMLWVCICSNDMGDIIPSTNVELMSGIAANTTLHHIRKGAFNQLYLPNLSESSKKFQTVELEKNLFSQTPPLPSYALFMFQNWRDFEL